MLFRSRRTVENKDVVISQALSHLPHNQQEEYHRLKKEIIRRESHLMKNGNNNKNNKVVTKVKDLSNVTTGVSLSSANLTSKIPIPMKAPTNQRPQSPAKTTGLETPFRMDPEQLQGEISHLKESEIAVPLSAQENTTAHRSTPNPTTPSSSRDTQALTSTKVSSLKQQQLLRKLANFYYTFLYTVKK